MSSDAALTSNIKQAKSSLWQDAYRRFCRNKAAVASLIVLLCIVLITLLGPLASPYRYDQLDWGAIQQAPNWATQHYFGTDALGRDLYVRTLLGGRISLMVGLLGALVAVTIGTLYGAISGFSGRNVDRVMMRTIDILNSLPFVFFVILLVTFFGQNIYLIFVAIGAIAWLDVARIVRGQTLSLKHKEFIEAAHVCGTRSLQIIWRHIVPNVLGIVVVYVTLLIPILILFESFLSFLGLGVQEPMTSWGVLLDEGAKSMEVAVWQLSFPTLFMVLTLFCFNFVGDGLRDALDPKQR